ncbi:hypothetical protein AAG570_003596 [Ranatra chinensis]|uniref:Uncharacterized protein n=1 Tax=Ranatra chinensis TaxID=642074 RepID=A0ABD0Y438_9HEMI
MNGVSYLLLSFFAAALVPGTSSMYRPSVETNEVLETSGADFIVDMFLAALREYLVKAGETQIPIPNINSEFKENWLGVEVDGSFVATGGNFTNPATIRRNGASTYKPIQDGFTFTTSVSFSQMDVYFDSYTVDLIGITESGKIGVRIGSNSIALGLSVVTYPKCRVSVDRVEMTDMSGVDVHMTGLGILDWLAEDITSWVLASYKTSFSDIIEQTLKEKLAEELVHTKICKMRDFPPDSYIIM